MLNMSHLVVRDMDFPSREGGDRSTLQITQSSTIGLTEGCLLTPWSGVGLRWRSDLGLFEPFAVSEDTKSLNR